MPPTAAATQRKLSLTVCPQGKAYISQSLMELLGLADGQRIDLVPPKARNGGLWHLDTRPTALATLTASPHKANAPVFRTRYVLSPRHFKNPREAGLLFKRLVLELAGEPTVAGFYPLKPNHALSTPK